ncbi:methanethiol S-methyltransferase [Allopontixanthobacter sp.]|uniref:methanethiol S-methyltransferase n=1 Tax=Allopontixanthobacter sp. TaxID=2906452 RepID=UPI002AB86F15|nr:methanethiol S-methyltransferase [Allopontixanthobacter sp.]MDZ4306955.1 isoprenylcysteine carboxylmethyltransferase family protein [Allopontixanthobacter sp.]
MSKAASLIFAVIAYAVFFATFLYLIAFVGNLPIVPVTVDEGPTAPPLLALLINVALIALFGLQHSIMARQGFKRAWKRLVPEQAERSVYVLAASAALIILFAFWRPIEGEVWSVTGVGAYVLWTLFAAGWLVVLLSTFLINHFELFGLQQAWFYVRGWQAAAPQFRQPFLYKLVRHPLYAGFFLAFWATPVMTYGHLLLAAGMSVYMIIAIRYEERDLVGLFGRDYDEYRQRVGMLTPRLRRTRSEPR